MKRLAALLLALAVATPAWGATYYVSPTGDSTYSGLSADAPKTLAWANLNIRAGDVCYLLDGTYADKLQPGNTGTSGSRITFIGDITTPGNVSVSQVQIDSTSAPTGGLRCGGFVTVKGVHSRTSVQLIARGPYDHTDSVLYCTADQGLNLLGRGKVTVRYCTFGDPDDYDNQSSIQYNSALRTEQTHYISGLQILDNTFYVNTTPTGSGGNAFTFRGLHGSTIARNRIHGTVVPTSQGKSIMTWYYTRAMTVTDNYFAGISHSGVEEKSYLISLRDNQRFNVFERDTFFEVTSNGTPGVTPIKVGLVIGGNDVNGVTDLGDRGNEFHNCFVKVRGYIEMANDLPRYIFRNNVFVTQEALYLGNYSFGYTDSIEFRHNTVVSFNAEHLVERGALRASTVTQNIFYAAVDRTRNALVVYTDGIAAGTYCSTSPGVADSNLVFAVVEADSADAFTSCSRGGSNEALPSVWCASTGLDCNSVWGSPAFADSSFWSFDPTPNADARALSAAFPDGYAGALDPTNADVTDPELLVNWPASGRALGTGARLPIAWTCSDAVGVTAVKLFYSVESTGPWFTLATKTGTSPNAHSYVVPLSWGYETLYLRVVAYDAAGNSTTSEQPYTVSLSERESPTQRDIAD